MTRTGSDPESEQGPLAISEATASKPLAVDEDGNVLIHMIRPCIGRGKGRHVYEAKMLESNAAKMRGWRMFVNHQSVSERKAKGGLPRDVEHLGGRVLESWWDASVPAQGRFGAGAIVGRVRPTPPIRELIQNDPELLETSINATATGVRPVMKDGARAWLVEGIEDKGTVDWVSEGGAGGRVAPVSILEAVYGTADEQEAAMLDSITDDELREHLASHRPGVLEAAKPKADPPDPADKAEDAKDKGADEEEELVASFMKKGLSRALAEKAAKRQLASAQEGAGDNGDDDKGDEVPVTAEQVEEALASPEVQKTIAGLIEAAVEKKVAESHDRIRAETRVDSERAIEIRDLRDRAHKIIREAKLPPLYEEESLAKFDLVEGEPTDALDLYEAVNEESGEVEKSAMDVLEESVTAEVERQRRLVGSLRPTRVRGQGAGTTALQEGEDKDGKGDEKKKKPDRVGPLTATLLQEASIDPDKAYAGTRG